MASKNQTVKVTIKQSGNWVYKGGKMLLKTHKGKLLSLKDVAQHSQAVLLKTAHDTLKKEQQRGFPKTLIVEVDNKHYKQILNVNPWGKIVFRVIANSVQLVNEMKKWLMVMSPVRLGRYRMSHIFLMGTPGGGEVATNNPEKHVLAGKLDAYLDADLHRMKQGYPAFVVNAQPYGLWLERGGYTASTKRLKKAGYAQFKGVYLKVVRKLKRKYESQYRFKLRILNAASSKGKLNAGFMGTLQAGRHLRPSEYRPRAKARGGVETYKLYGYPAIEFRKRKTTTLRVIDLVSGKGGKF